MRRTDRHGTTLVGSAFAALVCCLAAWAGNAVADEATGSAAGLAAACRGAASQFHPITQTDIQQVKQELIDALERLDARFSQDGANGEAWRSISSSPPPRKRSRRMVLKANSCGISGSGTRQTTRGWNWCGSFNVQRGLDNYISILGVAANEAKVRAAFQSRLERLASALERYAAQPTTADAEVINETLNWLRVARERRTWFPPSIDPSSSRTSTAASRRTWWGPVSPSRSTRR